MSVPPTERMEVDYFAGYDWVLENLRYEVFHVTSKQSYKKICDDSAIHPNIGNKYQLSFGASDISFFRNRGCVSLFDLRFATDEQRERFLGRCNPLGERFGGDEPVILVLKSDAYCELISWEGWKTEKAYGEMVVPYVEAGFPGPLPLSLIDVCLFVTVLNRPRTLQDYFKRADERSDTE